MGQAHRAIQGDHGALRKRRIASQARLARRAYRQLRTETASYWGRGILSALFGFAHGTPLFKNNIELCSLQEFTMCDGTLLLHRRLFSSSSSFSSLSEMVT